MSKGVVIYAFKKPAYGKFAWNLAVSIKENNPGIKVAVIVWGKALDHLEAWRKEWFDEIIYMDESDLFELGKFMPGKAKLSGYKYFPFDENMIIDADTICIGNLDIIWKKCTGNIHAQAVAKVTEQDTHWFCNWMNHAGMIEAFELSSPFTAYEINSSFMFVRKCEEGEMFYNQALKNYHLAKSHNKLRKWGGGFPDEAAFNVAFAQLNINPSFADQPIISNETAWPIFFSTRFQNDWSFVYQKFPLVGFFGDSHFTDKSLQAQYDRIMFGCGSRNGFLHVFKINQLMKEKHVKEK